MLPALTLCTLSLVATAPPPDRAATDAVNRALEYLQHSQAPDGAWRARNTKHAAITGLAVMAFLSAGHVPGEGRYGDTVERGIRWVMAVQQPSGLIATEGHEMMYHHGICTLMLAEAAGMTNDRLAAEVRKKLQKAVDLILQAQRTRGRDAGGWRYSPRGDDSDISVTGWQIMALRAAKNLGCDVPPESIARAVDYIQRCRDPRTGGYCYQPGSRVTVACTGTSVLALEICGKEQHGKPELLQAGSFILKYPPWESGHAFYGTYYCTQAMYQLGDNYWKVYQRRLHEALLGAQRTNGCWDGDGVGRDYCTAMAVLALTVDYGFLPIYQRGEDEGSKASK
jgi:prenyltransferase beta subunit